MISSAALMLALTIAGCDKNEEPKVPANPETPGTPTAPADRPIIFTTAIAATRSPQLEADGSGTCSLHDSKETFSVTKPEGNFFLYPQPTDRVSLEVHAGEATKQWTLSELAPKQDELESGKELTVKLTVRDGKILFAGMTIEGWGNQGTVDGEIIL